MGKGGGEPRYGWSDPYSGGRAQRYCVSSARRSEKSGGNATTDAVDGLQFPPDSSASQSQNPAGSSVGLDAGQDTEGLGGLNEGSEKALVVQLHAALQELDRAAGVFHAVTRTCIAVLLRFVRSLDYNLRKKLCEYILLNGEKAGKSSSKGNVAEGSDALHAKRMKLWVSKNYTGVRERSNKFGSGIWWRGPKKYFWLGTYETPEAAARARAAAANWLTTRFGSKLLNDEELDELQKYAKKAGDHLSDDRSHHNFASPVLVENLEEKATTSASLEGKAVASEEHVSQRDSPADENFSSEEHVSQWEVRRLENFLLDDEFPPLEDLSPKFNSDNHSPGSDMDNCLGFWKK
jgi:hypothetical protein